jgi:hypothetical protein
METSQPKLFDNVYISTFIVTMLVLYTSLLGPTLPPIVKTLFDNPIFKIIVLFMLVVRGNSDPSIAIMFVIAFVLTLDLLHTEKEIDKFTNIKKSLK